MLSELVHRDLRVNGIDMHVAEQGEGPLVLLCHGWPELGFTFRHQIGALAKAGFHVVAPDMRGYGRTEAPADVASYTIMHLVGDVVGLVAALGEKTAALVGHDWGASVAWTSALLRPDVFTSVAGLSVPFRQRGPAPPIQLLRANGLSDFYFVYFQEEGRAEAELERDVDDTMRRLLFSGSGDATPMTMMVPAGKGLLDLTTRPERLPAWLTEDDVAVYAAAHRRTGFRPGLNWYRNLDRNWELMAPFQDARVTQPALFIAGARDPIVLGPVGEAALARMPASVPRLEPVVMLAGAGHSIQEERPDEVNAALIDFLKRH